MSERVSPQAHELRTAVAACIQSGPLILGCSGGPDSLALVAAAHLVHQPATNPVAAVIVDHGLQSDSAAVAERAADACRALGIDDVEVVRVTVGTQGGPEAAARHARREALQEAALRRHSQQILLAHTLDDQAETVLLRLARGSGARSLSAMRQCDPPWHRPFLGISRAVVHEVAREAFEPLGFAPWHDPHNDDPAYARVRVRRSMDQLNTDLGPGIVESLARTAALLGDDADALDSWARGEFERLVDVEEGSCSADIAALAELPRAIRTRAIRLMHQHLVGISDELSFDHIQQVEASISRWKGQGPTALPGRVSAHLECGRLCLAIHEKSDTRE